MPNNSPVRTESLDQDQALNEAVNHSRLAWRRLGQKLASTTPAALARLLLVVGTLTGVTWLFMRSWVSLTPFIVGAILAYAVLPAVDALDRILPRRLAALVTMLGTLAFFALFLAQLVPVATKQYIRLQGVLPDDKQLQTLIADVDRQLETIPPAMRERVTEVVERTGGWLEARTDSLIDDVSIYVADTLLGIFGLIGAILGLLVLPVWMLTVLTEQRRGAKEIDQMLPAGVRGDFWALIRIVDRSFRTFFQSQVIQGFLVGLFMFAATIGLEYLNLIQVDFPLVVAILAGSLELIPEIGPTLAVVLLFFSGLLISPLTAVIAVVSYLLSHFLAGEIVSRHSERKVKPVNGAIMIVAVVALSTFGAFWVFLSLPIITTARDVLRYVLGRLEEPPRPVGVLPGEAQGKGRRAGATTAAAAPPIAAPPPLVYRRLRNRRSTRNG